MHACEIFSHMFREQVCISIKFNNSRTKNYRKLSTGSRWFAEKDCNNSSKKEIHNKEFNSPFSMASFCDQSFLRTTKFLPSMPSLGRLFTRRTSVCEYLCSLNFNYRFDYYEYFFVISIVELFGKICIE